MMGDGKDENLIRENAIDHIVREAVDPQLANPAADVRPNVGISLQPSKRVFDLQRKANTEPGDTLLQERRSFGQIVFGLEQQADVDQRSPSRARTRARASAAGTDRVSPAA